MLTISHPQLQEMGDELVVKTYDRFTELEVERTALEKRGGYSAVQPGDCVVAFSRRDIYGIKAIIEAQTGMKACVVYGALPPEMRRSQVRKGPRESSPRSTSTTSIAHLRRCSSHAVPRLRDYHQRLPSGSALL